MVRRTGGSRRKTRHLMKKHASDKGKIPITRFFTEYKEGDHVKLLAEPAVQKALFHLRFYGKNAIVQKRRGDCYEVTIKDGSKIKTLITHPIHLRKL